MKYILDFNSYIKESQVLNFSKYKDEIVNFIKKVKKGDKVGEYDSPFYHLIVNKAKVGDANNLGFTDDEIKKWKEYFKQYIFDTNGVWSQRSFNSNLNRKSGKRTYNYYITIEKDKKNIYLFWKVLNKLDKMISELSDKEKSPMAYKTHTLLDSFASHNDSLKVYYYDANLKDDVEVTIKKWVAETGLKISDRTHYHGVDIKDDSGDASSFGQLLSNSADKVVIDLIKKHGDNYTVEQYYQWIVKYLPDIIKGVKVDKK